LSGVAVSPKETSTRLRAYFSVPSAGGFSPYRTGQPTHVLFSCVIGQVTWLGLAQIIAPSWGVVIGGVFVAVLVVWGIGVRLGILSHYHLWLTLFILTVFVVGLVKFPHVAFPGLLAGLLSHSVVRGILKAVSRPKG
jgi:hypothetical protein